MIKTFKIYYKFSIMTKTFKIYYNFSILTKTLSRFLLRLTYTPINTNYDYSLS